MILDTIFSGLLSCEQVDATTKVLTYAASTNSYSSLYFQVFQPCLYRTIYYYLKEDKSTSSPLDWFICGLNVSNLGLFGSPKARVVHAKVVVQHHGDTCGLGQQAAIWAHTRSKLDEYDEPRWALHKILNWSEQILHLILVKRLRKVNLLLLQLPISYSQRLVGADHLLIHMGHSQPHPLHYPSYMSPPHFKVHNNLLAISGVQNSHLYELLLRCYALSTSSIAGLILSRDVHAFGSFWEPWQYVMH